MKPLYHHVPKPFSLITFLTLLKSVYPEVICPYYYYDIFGFKLYGSRSCSIRCCAGDHSYITTCCTDSVYVPSSAWWIGLIVLAIIVIIIGIVVIVILCKKKNTKIGRFEIPSLRNKWTRPAPAQTTYIIPAPVIGSSPNNLPVYKPEPLNVDQFIESNQPATINLQQEFDMPLPTLPAPVEYK